MRIIFDRNKIIVRVTYQKKNQLLFMFVIIYQRQAESITPFINKIIEKRKTSQSLRAKDNLHITYFENKTTR